MRLARPGLLLALLVGGAAHAGSYGGATLEAPGFRATIDASVGAWSDSDAEIAAFQEALATARRHLDENEGLVHASYDAYATGDHGWKRLRAHLVAAPIAGRDASVTARLWLVPEPLGGRQEVRFDLWLDEPLPEPLPEKLAADFACAQLSATLPAGAPHPVEALAVERLQAMLGANMYSGLRGQRVHQILVQARDQEPELRALATGDAPVPSATNPEYAGAGWAFARALVAVLDGEAPHTALPDLAVVDPAFRSGLVRSVALVLPDAHLEAGLRDLAARSDGLLARDGTPLPDWLAALGGAPPGP